jgi:hypothetical protein
MFNVDKTFREAQFFLEKMRERIAFHPASENFCMVRNPFWVKQ